MLSDKDKEISHLKSHKQNLEEKIRNSKNVEESPYRSNNDIEEEIKRLKKIIKEKDDEIKQIHIKIRCLEADNFHLHQQISELQPKRNDTKKTHKLDITIVKSVLSNNFEEIYRLRNHKRKLIGKIRKLKGTKWTEQSNEDIEGKLLDK